MAGVNIEDGTPLTPEGVDVTADIGTGAKAAQTSDAAAAKAEAKTVKYSFKGDRGGKPTSNRLSYPHDKVYKDHTDYVKFRFVKYNPPFATLGSNEFVDKDGKQTKELKGGEALNIYNNSIADFVDSGLPSILMYMPEDIGASYGANWGGKGFTNTGADILRGAGNLLNSGSAIDSIGSTLQNMGNAMTRGQSLLASGIAGAMNALPGKIGGSVDANDILGGIGGVILNPNAELLFSGFDLRNFGLSFKMAPRSKKEAAVIRDICTTFKRASLPYFGASPGNTLNNAFNKGKNVSEENNNRNYIGVPNLCIVEFMKGGDPHPYLTQFKPCAIKEVNITYTPDGQYSTYKDGSPVATGLTLSFLESKLVYSNEISYGGASY
ncbi:baseplate tail tube cap [Cyanophage S-RIM44]|uniref:Baseplate tail tube cap n=1 Tax=Cyanophage S-RIM44 TaxID=1278485 RepID=A0A1D7SCY8_9CAUD|nr:baseplate tail tube cap [Cyanophage S-RIM44]AOO11487.1 baseplate tail tube cap [Cyanophage S-RIM44]AOO12188.1 baseplate tail tube cap [Cyanophage S-RIM44]AOO12653.1 baseplate tail tube cap [Cyanophage S-RIM44]